MPFSLSLTHRCCCALPCSGTLQYAVRAKMIVTNPKANYDLDKDAPMEEEGLCSVCMQAAKPSKQQQAPTSLPSLPSLPQVTTKKGPEFHYLPRYVRVANEHSKAATARSMVSMSKSGPVSARV